MNTLEEAINIIQKEINKKEAEISFWKKYAATVEEQLEVYKKMNTDMMVFMEGMRKENEELRASQNWAEYRRILDENASLKAQLKKQGETEAPWDIEFRMAFERTSKRIEEFKKGFTDLKI